MHYTTDEILLKTLYILTEVRNFGCGQNLTTNALKHLVDQLEKRILQIYQSKITLKHL